MAKTSPHNLAPGVLLAGKYRLLRLLGEGDMSAVWAARNEATTGEVAVKIPHRVDAEVRQRLQREARAGATLKHRNVLEVHDVAQTDAGDPFLVMQLLRGETLKDLLARKPRIDAHEAARITRDVASALAVAHAQGLVHRDLKPGNLFLHYEPGAQEPVVKVLDFGVARDLKAGDAPSGPRAILGTPHYMSPEQARADADIDTRADLWSLGVILFEMLTGVRPFPNPREATPPPTERRPSTGDILSCILDDEIPRAASIFRGVDEDLDRLVDRCLRRDRAERPASAAAIVAELDAWLARAGAPVSARSTSARPPMPGNVAPSGTVVLGPDAPAASPSTPPPRRPPPPPPPRPRSAPPPPPRAENSSPVLLAPGLPVPPAPPPRATEPTLVTGIERRRSRFPLFLVTLLLLVGGGAAVTHLRPDLLPPTWVAALPPALRPAPPPAPAPTPPPAAAELPSAAPPSEPPPEETAAAAPAPAAATDTPAAADSATAAADASAAAAATASAAPTARAKPPAAPIRKSTKPRTSKPAAAPSPAPSPTPAPSPASTPTRVPRTTFDPSHI